MITLDDVTARCVYKPIRGERPLWDFPDGTLAGREVAAYLVSAATGWDIVPPTVLRDGPLGEGACQLWIDEPRRRSPRWSASCRPTELPRGLAARSPRPATTTAGRTCWPTPTTPGWPGWPLFDVVVNNADRKGGHVLHPAGGHLYGVDHGVCFHVEDKLRTVLWGWAGEPLPRGRREDLRTAARGPRRAARRARCASSSPTSRSPPPPAAAGPAAGPAPVPGAVGGAARRCRGRRSDGRALAARRVSSTAPARVGGMESWAAPDLPALPAPARSAASPLVAVRLGPAAVCDPTGGGPAGDDGPATMYVCGITPYDATHLGPRRHHDRVRPGQPVLAGRGPPGRVRAERHRHRRPAAGAGQARRRGLDRARDAGDRAVPGGHGGAADPAAGALRRRGRVDPARSSTRWSSWSTTASRTGSTTAPATSTST